MKKQLMLVAAGLLAASYMDAATVYFDNTDTGWEKVYGYSWSPDYLQELSTVEIDGHTLYAAELDNEKIIFRSSDTQWGDDKQTADLKVVDGAVYGKGSLKSNGGTTKAIATITDGKYVADEPVVDPSGYPDMYLAGEISGWSTDNDDYKMTTTDGVTYTLTVENMNTGGFKFCGGNWQTRNLGGGGTLLEDGTYDLSKDGGDMTLKKEGPVTFTLVQSDNFNSAKLTVSGVGEVEPDKFTAVYLLSDRNGFVVSQQFKMATTDGITYTLNIPDAGSDIAFKFMAKTTPVKYFSNGQQNIPNGEITIEGNNSTDMTFHTGGNVNITLTNVNNFSSIIVNIEGQDPDADPFPPIYLVGDMNGWKAQENYRLQTTDGETYTITVPNMSGDANFKFMGGDAHNNYFSCGKQNMQDGEYELNTLGTTGDMSLATGGDVTFTFVLGELHHSATLTVAGQGEVVEDEYPPMYLTSERYGWGARDALKMHTEDGVTYTLNVPDMSTSPFKFHGGDWGTRELTGAGNALENGTYDLRKGSDNMTLAVGGNVTFTLVQENDFATAKLTIEGQEGEAVKVITYALHGQFNGDSWNTIQMPAVEGEEGIYSASFTPTYSGGNFGVQMNINGNQEEWYNEDVTFSASNPSATLTKEAETEEGVNCKFDFPANVKYTATFNANTLELTFSGFGDEPIDPIEPSDLPETLYAIGQINGNGWTPENGVALTKESDGVFTLTNAEIKGTGANGYFSFTTKLGDWDNCGDRYQDANGDGGVMEPVDGVITGTLEKRSDDAAFEVVNGTYDITVDLNTMKLTMTVVSVDPVEPDDPITDEFTYGIHGDFSGQWATTAMTKEEDSNLWTLTFVPEKENAEFGVKKLKGEEQAAWLCAAVTFNEENPSAELTGGGNCIFGFPVNKEYKATYNPETNVLSFVATGNEPVIEYPETLYMLGTVNGNSWAANEGVKMEKIGEAKYQVENVDIHNGAGIEGEPAVGNFSFATSLGADATDWDGLGKRYGNAGADNEEWNVSTTAAYTGDIAVGDHAIQVPAAEYIVTVDLAEMTVTLLWSESTGISSISADADEAIYFNLQGVRVHNPESGLYIKVVNGESKKVLVK